MSKIMAYRDACLADLKRSWIGSTPKVRTMVKTVVKTVDTHAGKLDDEELKKMLTNAPALYLVFLGITGTEPRASGGSLLTAKFAVFIVTRDLPKIPRDLSAVEIAEQLLVMLDRYQPTDDMGISRGRVAGKLRFDNLFSSGTSGRGQMLSAVSWETGITVEGAPLPDPFAGTVHGINDTSFIAGDAT